jgi:hypothetical protein
LDNAVYFQSINSTVEISLNISKILADYRLRDLVNLMVANIRLLAPLSLRQNTQFATIKSPIDAEKFSNTIRLSPN